MKAVVFRNKGDFGVEEVPKPACPKGGILVKVVSVGLCGSDVRTFYSGHFGVTPPFILGHEAVGVIEESDNERYPVGMHAAINPVVGLCRKCFFCLNGLENHCENKITLGTDIPGGYAQYTAIPRECCTDSSIVKVPEDFNLDLLPLAETVSSVYNAHDWADVGEGDTILIMGAGPLGNLHSAVAKARGAKKIIISEPSENRLEMAHRFKTTDVFNNPVKEPVEECVMRETDGHGVDKVIVACPVGPAQEQATHLVRPRGTVILFGGLPADKNRVAFDSNLIHYKEIRVIGSFAYASETFNKGVDLVVSGKLDASKFITHIMSIDDVHKGVEAIKSGEAIKVILKPFE